MRLRPTEQSVCLRLGGNPREQELSLNHNRRDCPNAVLLGFWAVGRAGDHRAAALGDRLLDPLNRLVAQRTARRDTSMSRAIVLHLR